MARQKIDRIHSLGKSRRLGKLDGREGLPELEVDIPHSPFLSELKSIGEQHVSQVSQSLAQELSDYQNEIAENLAQQSSYSRIITDLGSDIETTEKELNSVREDYRGDQSDSVSSKVADRRYLGGMAYLIIVLLTIVGEVVITYPAFTELFSDLIFVAILATLAASAMTISYSHILGLSLKRNDDKKRRQPRWVMPALLASSIPVIGLVMSLSNVRSKKFASSESLGVTSTIEDLSTTGDLDSNVENFGETENFGFDTGLDFSDPGQTLIGDSPLTYWAAFSLFAFLQLALMAVATFASYHHFSNSLAEEERLTKHLTKLRSSLGKSQSTKTKLEKEVESMDLQRNKILASHKAQVENIERKIYARAQAFWGANLRQRSDSPLAKSREFVTPQIDRPDWFS